MSVEALPYTVLILLAEFTIGGLWVLLAADMRGSVARSFVKFGAVLLMISAALTLVVAAIISVPLEVDGYRLDPAYMSPTRVSLAALFALTIPYSALVIKEARQPSLVTGAAAATAGLVSLALLAQVFALPTWGYVGTILSLLVGALAVGAVSMGMILGHWYLVTPRLPEKPLREMTALLLVVLAVQVVLLAPNLALPHDSIPNAIDLSINENPFFWMRVAGGLAFPMLLTYMAFDSSGARAMQSATGLLYIAMALVISGEILAKGLLFVTAVPS